MLGGGEVDRVEGRLYIVNSILDMVLILANVSLDLIHMEKNFEFRFLNFFDFTKKW
jgi:hypothetical protein